MYSCISPAGFANASAADPVALVVFVLEKRKCCYFVRIGLMRARKSRSVLRQLRFLVAYLSKIQDLGHNRFEAGSTEVLQGLAFGEAGSRKSHSGCDDLDRFPESRVGYCEDGS